MAGGTARKVRLFGRVQGVFFRQWTLGQARELGLAGWVRNCRDGSVEAHLIGDPETLDTMVGRMRSGPSQARVDDMTVETVEPEEIEGFSVRL